MTGTITKRDAVDAALSIAESVGAGTLSPRDLEQQVVAELTALVGQVVGDGDPLFELQCQIARGVLAVGGIGADELSEWAARQRRLEGVGSGAVAATGAPSPSGVDDAPPEPNSSLSVAHSPEIDELGAEDSD